MRLNEIKLFKDPSDERFSDAFARFVNEKGLKFGEGGQARVVWISGKNWVWRSWFNDRGYERFLEYIEANPNNPYLPKILNKVREEPVKFKGMPSGMKIKYVKLEKLTPVPFGVFADAIDAVHEIVGSKVPHSVEDLIELVEEHGEPQKILDAIEQRKEFFETILDLVRDHDANDISVENVMMRGNVPVVMDPFKD